jgi:hypothetical protein
VATARENRLSSFALGCEDRCEAVFCFAHFHPHQRAATHRLFGIYFSGRNGVCKELLTDGRPPNSALPESRCIDPNLENSDCCARNDIAANIQLRIGFVWTRLTSARSANSDGQADPDPSFWQMPSQSADVGATPAIRRATSVGAECSSRRSHHTRPYPRASRPIAKSFAVATVAPCRTYRFFSLAYSVLLRTAFAAIVGCETRAPLNVGCRLRSSAGRAAPECP